MKRNFTYYIYFALIFLSIFTDCTLANRFGYFGRSVLNFITLVLFLTLVVLNRKIEIDSFLKRMWILLFYLIILGVVGSLIWTFTGHYSIIYGENVYIKAIKVDVYWIIIVLYMTSVYMCIRRLSRNEIWKPFAVTFNFLFIYLVLEFVTMPYAFHIGNSAGIYYDRIRLTTTESSLTIPMILVFGIGSIIYHHITGNKLKLFITYIMGSVFIFTSGSKTLFVIMIIYGVIYFVSYLKKLDRGKVQLLLFVFVCISVIGAVYGIKLVNTMNRYKGSYGIRGLGILASIIHMIWYPFGVGGGVYLYTYQQCAVNVYNYLSEYALFKQFVGNDVRSLINASSDSDVICIAGITSQSLYWGIIGTLYWAYSLFIYIKEGWKRIFLKEVIWYKFLIAGILLLWGFFVPFTNHYMTWGMLIVMFSQIQSKIGECANEIKG